MAKIRLTSTVTIPDPLKISRYQKVPELGPRVLFFSGGTALNGLSRVLKNYTHNSTHLVTPFDSGGSSAKLRKAFSMPSIGDLRSRLMALADESVTGHPEIYELFNHRFATDAENADLRKSLASLVKGKHPLVAEISNPMRRLICNQIGFFLEAMPEDFDLRGASLGNLILTGGYLNNHQHLDPIIFLFSKLVNVRGTVRAVVNEHLHLGAELQDGKRIIGQHLLTGKEVAAITAPIKSVFLSESISEKKAASGEIRKKNRKLIERADLICYPMGSFYTSLVANFLPKGVGSAIASNGCPKVYVPNLGTDPEQLGMELDGCVESLIKYLRADVSAQTSTDQLLNFVMMDTKSGRYPGDLSAGLRKKLGLQVIDARLVSKQSAPHYDPELLVSALLSLT